ncbi:protein Mis18-alpha [Pyxicephalus adspersus]
MDTPAFRLDNLRQQPEDITVFMCGKCRLPLGDSSDWDGRIRKEGVVHLNAVSENVCCPNDSEGVISSFPNETYCVFQILQCKGCGSPIGRIYVSTPKTMDSKVDVFILNLSAVTTYTLGSAKKQVVPQYDIPLTLEKCHEFEQDIKKCKQILGVLQRKVETLQSQLESQDSP